MNFKRKNHDGASCPGINGMREFGNTNGGHVICSMKMLEATKIKYYYKENQEQMNSHTGAVTFSE